MYNSVLRLVVYDKIFIFFFSFFWNHRISLFSDGRYLSFEYVSRTLKKQFNPFTIVQ